MCLTPPTEGFPWYDLRKIYMHVKVHVKDDQRTKWRRNIAENFNRRVHERYRQTTDRQTDGRRHIAREFTFANNGKRG